MFEYSLVVLHWPICLEYNLGTKCAILAFQVCSGLLNRFPTEDFLVFWTVQDFMLKKSGSEDKMLISMWEN